MCDLFPAGGTEVHEISMRLCHVALYGRVRAWIARGSLAADIPRGTRYEDGAVESVVRIRRSGVVVEDQEGYQALVECPYETRLNIAD